MGPESLRTSHPYPLDTRLRTWLASDGDPLEVGPRQQEPSCSDRARPTISLMAERNLNLRQSGEPDVLRIPIVRTWRGNHRVTGPMRASGPMAFRSDFTGPARDPGHCRLTYPIGVTSSRAARLTPFDTTTRLRSLLPVFAESVDVVGLPTAAFG